MTESYDGWAWSFWCHVAAAGEKFVLLAGRSYKLWVRQGLLLALSGLEADVRVLVYGAGVLGCELAHCLCSNAEAEVTVLARGAWAKMLETEGLRIHHSVQRKDTIDHPRIVRELAANDAYDLVFVVVQSSQLDAVLPVLVANASNRLVFIGNQPDASGVERRIQAVAFTPKECAFAFFSTGGRREGGRVLAAHLKDKLTVGGTRAALSADFSRLLDQALAPAGVGIVPEDQMDGWLKWHAACILPMAYLSYARGCDLTRSTRADRALYLDACAELVPLFEARSIPIRPKGDETFFAGGWKRMYLSAFYAVVFKTFLGRLCVTDHCQHAASEMRFMADSLERTLGLDELPGAAPSYQALKTMMPTWEALAANPCCGA